MNERKLNKKEKINNKEKEKIITVNLKVILSPWLSN